MGEVYRARDIVLGRIVALKILPAMLSTDPERVVRFEREARTLAALNHPHIAQLYGVETGALVAPNRPGDQSEASVSCHALVMELVEGETVAERIARGASHSMMLCRLPGRWPMHSRPRMSRASFIAI